MRFLRTLWVRTFFTQGTKKRRASLALRSCAAGAMSGEDDFTAPPVIAFEDLILGQRAATPIEAAVVFDRCEATAEEIDACEAHLRRCLVCPVTARPPAYAARAELLEAVLYEMRPGAPPGTLAPLPPQPEPAEAARLALADLEGQIGACAAEAERFRAPTRRAAAEWARWQWREGVLRALAKPLRARIHAALAEPQPSGATAANGPAPETPTIAASASDTTASAPASASVASRVRRALSFDKRLRSGVRAHKPAGGAGASGVAPPDASHAEGDASSSVRGATRTQGALTRPHPRPHPRPAPAPRPSPAAETS
jgi:hypothetical protein